MPTQRFCTIVAYSQLYFRGKKLCMEGDLNLSLSTPVVTIVLPNQVEISGQGNYLVRFLFSICWDS